MSLQKARRILFGRSVLKMLRLNQWYPAPLPIAGRLSEAAVFLTLELPYTVHLGRYALVLLGTLVHVARAL